MSQETPRYSVRLWAEGVSEPIETLWRLVRTLDDAGFPIQYEAGERRPLRRRKDLRDLFAAREKRQAGKVDHGVGVSVDNLLTAPPKEEPLSFSFTAGSKASDAVDSFILKLPRLEEVFNRTLSVEQLDRIFRAWVKAIEPFWGAVINSVNEARHLGLDQPYEDSLQMLREHPINLVDGKKVPQLVHWYDYFGSAFVGRLGGFEKLLTAPVHRAEAFHEGVLWILTPEPFDDRNPDHRALQEGAAEYLNLEEIHEAHRRQLPRWPE
jgi:hypothetical protein